MLNIFIVHVYSNLHTSLEYKTDYGNKSDKQMNTAQGKTDSKSQYVYIYMYIKIK
jgi:hypothetical protein